MTSVDVLSIRRPTPRTDRVAAAVILLLAMGSLTWGVGGQLNHPRTQKVAAVPPARTAQAPAPVSMAPLSTADVRPIKPAAPPAAPPRAPAVPPAETVQAPPAEDAASPASAVVQDSVQVVPPPTLQAVEPMAPPAPAAEPVPPPAEAPN